MFFRKLLSSLNAKVKKTAVGVLSVAMVAVLCLPVHL